MDTLKFVHAAAAAFDTDMDMDMDMDQIQKKTISYKIHYFRIQSMNIAANQHSDRVKNPYSISIAST